MVDGVPIEMAPPPTEILLSSAMAAVIDASDATLTQPLPPGAHPPPASQLTESTATVVDTTTTTRTLLEGGGGLVSIVREYDPNRHCGVVDDETTARPCTRSLTCKQHTAVQRRSVTGRRDTFDQLLNDYRMAKESAAMAIANDGGGAEIKVSEVRMWRAASI